MKMHTGFLLDVYEHPRKGVVLWLLCEDGIRRSFSQDFATSFFVRGHPHELRKLCIYLWGKKHSIKMLKVNKEDLFDGKMDVLEVRAESFQVLRQASWDALAAFPDLTYYDIDTALYLRHVAVFNVFPMIRCKIHVIDNEVTKITPLDSRWDLDPVEPSLRTMTITPNCDPVHASPTKLRIQYNGFDYMVDLSKPRDLLYKLNSILQNYNPDLIVAPYSDTWLFDLLVKTSKETGIPFNPNRDFACDVLRKEEITYFAYGQAHYRAPQVHLYGRWNIDPMNCDAFAEHGLEGALELSRITGIPIQEAARRSAGAGISAMQVIMAMRRGVMIPYQHQQSEVPKSWSDLFKLDQGGSSGGPKPGVRPYTAIVDFSMMFPSRVVQHNISYETVGVDEDDAFFIPEINTKISRRRGLLPETLEPMVDKRTKLLTKLEEMNEDHPKYQQYQARADVIKGLGVVSNGRLGFAMAIFGRINAFETLAWVVRKVLMEAKNIASDLDCKVYHWYVDSLFIARDGCTTKADFQDVVDAIEGKTKCKIKVEEAYTWIAFVSSTEDPDLPVANKFFCRKPDGTLKIRGLHERRDDTCEYVRELQRNALTILAAEPDIYKLQGLLPAIVKTVRAQIDDLQKEKIPLGDLISTHVLSREWNEYTAAVPHSIAAAQLAAIGKPLHMGQAVRYVHTLGQPGVLAWDLSTRPDTKAINIPHYEDLVLRAIYEVVRPLGVPEQLLGDWLLHGATYIHPEDFAHLKNKRFDAEMPLFTTLDAYEKKLIGMV